MPSDNDFQKYFQAMPVPRFVIRRKEKNLYVVSEANELALKYFDLPSEQVVKHPIQDFMDADNTMHFQQSFG